MKIAPTRDAGPLSGFGHRALPASLVAGAAVIAIVAAAGPTDAASSGSQAAVAYRRAVSPRVGLVAVSAVRGSADAWALGSSGGLGAVSSVLRYNGGKWSVAARKLPATAFLSGIAATSRKTAWVAGTVGGPFSGTRPTPYLARFSGGSLHRVDLKALGKGGLVSIAAASASDIWAVGFLQVTRSLIRPLALRWNGRSWRKVTVLAQQAGLSLDAVSAVGPATAWAAATDAAGNSEVLRWNGTGWSLSLTAPSDIGLNGVAASSGTNAWVVGEVVNGTAAGYSAHWNGHSWTTEATPKLTSQLNDVALWQGRVWAVGEVFISRSSDRAVPEMLYSTGGAWRRQAAPDPGASKSSVNQSRFVSLSAASSHFVIAVGDNGTECTTGTGFADIYNGQRWTAAVLPPRTTALGALPDCGG